MSPSPPFFGHLAARAAELFAEALATLGQEQLGELQARLAAALDLATADELAGLDDRLAALTARLAALDPGV